MSSTPSSGDGMKNSTFGYGNSTTHAQQLDLLIHPLILSFLVMFAVLTTLFVACGIYLKINPQRDEKNISQLDDDVIVGGTKKKRKKKRKSSDEYQYDNPVMTLSARSQLKTGDTVIEMGAKEMADSSTESDDKFDEAAKEDDEEKPQKSDDSLPTYNEVKL